MHQNDPKLVLKHQQYINMNLRGGFGPKMSCPKYGRRFKSRGGKFPPPQENKGLKLRENESLLFDKILPKLAAMYA